MRYARLGAVAALIFGAIQAHGQSVVYNFTDGTSDGWANSGFGVSPLSPVVNIGGVNYISVPYPLGGGFQVANVSHGADGSDFFNAMAAAAANPAGYNISYTYYLNTAGITGATFLQLGTFVNTGSGYYAQDFGAPNEVQFNGTQLASGQVFTGTVSFSLAAAGFAMPAGETFFRLGLIENSSTNAVGLTVDFTGISVTPTPEPTSLALLGLAAPAFWMIRCRRSAKR